MTSVTVPKLEGSSKEAAYFDLEWEAETVRWLKGDNSEIRRPNTKEKAWLCSNFRFEMGSLPCSRVATVQSFTWKCVWPGPARRADQAPGEGDGSGHQNRGLDGGLRRVVAGGNKVVRRWPARRERRDVGRDRLPCPDLKTEIGRVTLEHCGFARFTHGTFDANSEKVARFSCEFYVESMKFVIRNEDDPK